MYVDELLQKTDTIGLGCDAAHGHLMRWSQHLMQPCDGLVDVRAAAVGDDRGREMVRRGFRPFHLRCVDAGDVRSHVHARDRRLPTVGTSLAKAEQEMIQALLREESTMRRDH